MTSHSVFGRLKAALAAGTVAAVTLSGLAAAPAFAAPSAATPAIAPAVVEGTPVTDVQFRWGLNNETNNGAFDGSMNLLAAGAIDKTSGGDRISQTEWKAEDGNVSIEKLNSSGGYDLATWAGLTTNAAGASIKPPTNTNYSGHQVVIDGGTGTVDPAAGTASYQWQGTFTVAYYQGLTQFTVKDPALTVDADGTGSVTATLGGWGTSMEDPELFLVLDEVPNVEIATLTDVEVTPGGVIATPDYAGVEVTVPEGAQQQTRTTGFGSFPQGFIDFQQKTGQSSYWFTSGGSTDAAKVASALSATHEAVEVEPEPTENPEPTDTPEPTVTPEPTETATPEPTETVTPEPTETAVPTESPEPAETIEVSGAQLEWAYSRYAQYGVFGWWYQAASGAKVSLAEWRDGQTISGNAEDANVAFHGVRFEGGTGTIDAETGAGTITWANTGNWVLNAYRNAGYDIAPDETLANPILTIAADGTGVLSFDATIPEHVDFMYSGQTVPQVGPQRVTLATFSEVSIDDNGTLTLVPDYAGRAAPSTQTDWLDCEGIGGSWPAEWVDFVPSSVKTHYYTTSCSGLNLKKPALPVTVRTEATAPSIVSQPTSSVTAVKAGALLSYQVSANGTGISYQWQRSLDGGQNWTDVEGETGYKYLGRAKVSDDGGSFRVVVSGNGGESVTSAAVGPITVTTEALGTPNFSNTGTVGLGDAAYVGASVTGAPLPEYEWQKQIDGVWTDVEPNRTVVSGQRVESGFNFTAVTWEDAGTYRVTISNGIGDPIVSEPMTLTVVNEAPSSRRSPRTRSP